MDTKFKMTDEISWIKYGKDQNNCSLSNISD